MSSIVLGIHIVLAVVTIGYSVRVALQPRSAKKQVQHMWQSFGGVAVTGVALAVLHPGSIGKVCFMSAAYIAALSAVHYRYKHTQKLVHSRVER